MTLEDTRSAADIPEPEPLVTHGPARVIAMVNQKGGVGKTTSTVSLGAALAGYGRRVLLVDFDPQGAIAISFGINPSALELTVYNLITDEHRHIDEVIVHSDVENLDLLPSNIALAAAELQLVSEVGREYALKRALDDERNAANANRERHQAAMLAGFVKLSVADRKAFVIDARAMKSRMENRMQHRRGKRGGMAGDMPPPPMM